MGGATLLAILVLLGVVSAGLVFGLVEEEPSPPSAALELQPTEGGGQYRLVHTSGERIDGSRVTLQGVADPDALAGTKLKAGESVTVDPQSDTVTVLWDSGSRDSYVLAEFDSFTLIEDALTGGSVLTRVDGKLQVLDGDGGALIPFSGTGKISALGPAASDLDGDGLVEAPYIDAGGDLRLVDNDSETTTLVNDSNISGTVHDSKTRLVVGSWNGTGPSVFFTGDTDTIYRVSPGGSPSEVATPDNGVNSVVGVGDVDGDGTGELVFGGASQEVRYLEPDGTTGTTGVTAGSNNGIGTGALADFDGDGTERVVIVDGGNNIQFVGVTGGEPDDSVTSGDVAGGSAPQARKSPPTVADVDGDGEAEIVYLGNDDGKLKYLDGVAAHVPSGSPMERKFLNDDTGSKVDGSEIPGLTS